MLRRSLAMAWLERVSSIGSSARLSWRRSLSRREQGEDGTLKSLAVCHKQRLLHAVLPAGFS